MTREVSQFARNLTKEGIPIELLEIHRLRVLGIPLAPSWAGLQDVPARLVDDNIILLAGYEDAAEWQRLDAEKAGNK